MVFRSSKKPPHPAGPLRNSLPPVLSKDRFLSSFLNMQENSSAKKSWSAEKSKSFTAIFSLSHLEMFFTSKLKTSCREVWCEEMQAQKIKACPGEFLAGQRLPCSSACSFNQYFSHSQGKKEGYLLAARLQTLLERAPSLGCSHILPLSYFQPVYLADSCAHLEGFEISKWSVCIYPVTAFFHRMEQDKMISPAALDLRRLIGS